MTGSGCGDGGPALQAGQRELAAGFVLQGSKQGVVARIAELEGHLVDAGVQVVPVSFFTAEFSGGDVSFWGARFSGGNVYFMDAKLSGGVADFSTVADWSVPPAFTLTDAPPPGLKLPKKQDQSQAQGSGN